MGPEARRQRPRKRDPLLVPCRGGCITTKKCCSVVQQYVALLLPAMQDLQVLGLHVAQPVWTSAVCAFPAAHGDIEQLSGKRTVVSSADVVL